MNRELSVKKDGEHSYKICFRQGFSSLLTTLENEGIKFHRACIVTDSNVDMLYGAQLFRLLEGYCHNVCCFSFQEGEEQKHLDTVQGLYEKLIEEEFDRDDILIALGGGVTGDLTGFAASTYLRGIRFIQLPTTLLSQVDSSIGGKTGVDFRGYKNMVGAFHQPSLVYINTDVLDTLNKEQFACGMAEILKAGLLADQEFFLWILENHKNIMERNLEIMEEMIWKSCCIKGEIVEKDPMEKGVRALLNLGHTIGHAVEKLLDFRMLHGQCVALGYVAAAFLSVEKGHLEEEDLMMIKKANQLFGLPNQICDLDPKKILDATRKDKKMKQGSIKFILLRAVGEAYVDTTVTDEEMTSGIAYILEV